MEKQFISSGVAGSKGFSSLNKPAKDFVARINEGGKGLSRFRSEVGGISAAPFAALLDAVKGTEAGIKSANAAALTLGKTIAGLAVAGTIALGAVIKQGFEFASAIQQQDIALEGLEKQLESTAENSRKRLQEFANTTIFTYKTATDSVVKLAVGLNLNLEESLAILTEIAAAGAAVGASEEQINRAALAITQMGTRGKVSQQELNQLSEALPNLSQARIFEEIAKDMGITVQRAKELAEQGEISSEVGIRAVRAVLRGADTGALAKQAGTLQNVFSSLADTIRNALGNSILEAIERAGGLENILKLVEESIPPLVESIGKLTTALIEAAPKVVILVDALVDVVNVGADVISFFDAFLGKVQELGTADKESKGIGGFIDRIFGVGEREKRGFRDILEFMGVPKFFLGAGEEAAEAFNKPFLEESTSVQREIEKAGAGAAEAAAAAARSIDFQGQADAFRKTIKERFDALGGILDAQNAIKDAIRGGEAAQRATTNAIRAAADAHQRVRDLLQEQQRILSDTSSEQLEIAQAADRLLRAGRALTELDQQRLTLQQQLAELQRPANAREQEEVATRLERAQIALNQAKRDELDLTKAITQEQRSTIDLRGLSVDQIKNRLQNAKAALQAQRARQQAVKDSRTQQEIDEERRLAALNTRDAEIEVADAKQAQEDLNNRALLNRERIRDVNEQLFDLEIDVRDAKREQVEADEASRHLAAGDTQRARDLLGIAEQITAAKRSAQDADQQVRDAQDSQQRAQDAITKARQTQAELLATQLGDERTLNQIFLDRVDIIARMGGDAGKSAREALAASLPALLATANLVDPVTGTPLGGPPLITQGMVKTISDALLSAPGSDLRAILREILRKIGLQIPGLAIGGLVEGSGAMGTLHRLGEYGRPELVLPLTNSDRVWQLLSQNLPKYPGALAAAQQAILPTTPTLKLPSKANGAGGFAARATQRQANSDLAKAIVQEMIEAGFNGDAKHVEVTINQTAANQQLSEREVRRIIERAIQ